MRVLVTGSAGFVGSHLVEHLRSVGDEVVCWGVDGAALDITDRGAVFAALSGQRLDGVYHLAAQSRVDRSWEAPGETMTINAAGTANLVEAMTRVCDGSKPRLLLLSSAEVYGIVGDDALPLTEDQPSAPRSPYGVSKAAAEQIARVYGAAQDVEVVVCRPFNLIGPGQQPAFVTSAFARNIVENERTGGTRVEVGNLSATRDFLDVRDAVGVYRALMADGVDGEVYNVCRGEETSVRSLLDHLIAESPIDHEVIVDEGRFRPNDLPRMYGSNAKTAALTDWTPQRSLDETLRDVLGDWRNREAFT